MGVAVVTVGETVPHADVYRSADSLARLVCRSSSKMEPRVPSLRAHERTGNSRLSSTFLESPTSLFVHMLRFHV